VDDKVTPLDAERGRGDYESFLQDLEEDREMRDEVNLYKDPAAIAYRQQAAPSGTAPAAGAVADDDDDDDDELSDAEDVGLEELLDDLTLRDHEEFGDSTPPATFAMPGAGGSSFHFT
jgi:nonsense-mediated mRNA decay protein 3